MTARRRLPLSLAVVLVATAVVGCSRPSAQTVEISIHDSAFDPAQLRVPAGVPITFVLVNEDPIDHEWLIGDDDVHERHRTGTHAAHGTVPTEVSVPALETVETTIIFQESGELAYVCHLPGHEAYGMVGRLAVEG
ncbi:MAG: cupredoxin domain-containing protein [Chloroflexota bacterium]|nr:cupredoxin domain-containing protein [Chloroflexota bacterium]